MNTRALLVLVVVAIGAKGTVARPAVHDSMRQSIGTNSSGSATGNKSPDRFVNVFFLSNDVFGCNWTTNAVETSRCKKAEFFLEYHSLRCTAETCVLIHSADVDARALPSTMATFLSNSGGRYYSAKYDMWKDYFDTLTSSDDATLYALLDLDFIFPRNVDRGELDLSTTYVYRVPAPRKNFDFASYYRPDKCLDDPAPNANELWGGLSGYVYGSAIVANRVNTLVYLDYTLKYAHCFQREWDFVLTTAFAYSHQIVDAIFYCRDYEEVAPTLPVHINVDDNNPHNPKGIYAVIGADTELKYTYGILPNGFVNRTFLRQLSPVGRGR